MTATALVGAQYGSEGKGLVAAHVAARYGTHVRTGAPNAGHTFSHRGRYWVARSIPCGWVNPDALLVLGPGALIDPDLLEREITAIEQAGYKIRDRLLVDPRAGLIDPVAHHRFEGGVNGDAHRLIGSTGEGVGPARMAKIARGTVDAPWAVYETAATLKGINLADTAAVLHGELTRGGSVLLEGTQGSGLSLTHGPWPYVTSADTNAAQLAADAGISPTWVERTILVARTYPIRVAGNSGPLDGETTWQAVGQPPEQTTVTKKTRRVGVWDATAVAKAATLNHPADLVVTFLDYLFPASATVTTWEDLPADARAWLDIQEDTVGARVVAVGTGPDSMAWRP